MGAAEIAETLPLWAVYAIAFLGIVAGGLGMFVLGLIGNVIKQRRGAGASGEHVDGGDRRDCDDCAQMALARDEFKSLWEEIKTLRKEGSEQSRDMTSRLDNLFTFMSKK